MWQQFADPTVGLSRQARQDVLDIEKRIMAVEFGRLDQTHDGSGAFAGAQAAGKQPVLSTRGNRSDTVLDPVIVDWHLTVAEIMDQGRPALETVIDGFCRR